MKIAAIAAAAIITATSVSAAEIGATGISIGAELDTRYNIDTETLTSTLSPGLGYTWEGFALSADMDFVLYENDFTLNNDKLPTLDFGAEYGMQLMGLNAKVYGETGYDLEKEAMDDLEVGVSFSF